MLDVVAPRSLLAGSTFANSSHSHLFVTPKSIVAVLSRSFVYMRGATKKNLTSHSMREQDRIPLACCNSHTEISLLFPVNLVAHLKIFCVLSLGDFVV